jgi:quinol monooxygenase YgiN
MSDASTTVESKLQHAGMPVIAIAEIFGISGRRSELVELLTRTEQHARELPGSRRYVFAADLETPNQFVLLSEWDTHEDMAAYHRSEQFARYQVELHGLLARPSEMTVYSVTDTLRPVPGGPPDPRDAD